MNDTEASVNATKLPAVDKTVAPVHPNQTKAAQHESAEEPRHHSQDERAAKGEKQISHDLRQALSSLNSALHSHLIPHTSHLVPSHHTQHTTRHCNNRWKG